MRTATPRTSTQALLRDGRHVNIRPLTAEDGPALVAALDRADPWDLRRRFMGPPPPASVLAAQLERMDSVHDFALGAFDDDGRLVGVAQFDRADDRPVAEMAIEVAHDWQRIGLGSVMVDRLVAIARSLGIHEFVADYYADNIAIRHLLRHLGKVTSGGIDHGTSNARVDLDVSAA